MINPFDNDIVKNPRKVERSVKGLNDAIFNSLMGDFRKLEEGPTPRAIKNPKARFVLSPQPGYGKSHLIGRLFRELRGRATLVYLKPFSEASACWRSILLKIAQEMEFPDDATAATCLPSGPNQLEVMAHETLMKLAAGAIEHGLIPSRDKNGLLRQITSLTLPVIQSRPKWKEQLKEKRESLSRELHHQLSSVGLQLSASPVSWVGTLFSYAYYPDDFGLRQSCLDWLKGCGIDDADADHIGIRSADLVRAESSRSEVNDLCLNRILDFCRLAGFSRPFLFCIDQTEHYTSNPSGAGALGMVIQILADDGFNQMTVMTTNQQPWVESIKPTWQDAYFARLSKPMELKGITLDQAEEMVRNRTEGINIEAGLSDEVRGRKWIAPIFDGHKELGIRLFLEECGNLWDKMIRRPSTEITIEATYHALVNNIRTDPKRLVFDPDIFHWLVCDVAGGITEISVEKFESQKGYLTLRWTQTGKAVYFGFEPDNHHKRWKAICDEAFRFWTADNERSKCVFFRTREMKTIPGNWAIAPRIEDARRKYLHVMEVEDPDVAKLYAAYDLYLAATEGDIPFDRNTTIAYIRGVLGWFWKALLELPPSERKPPQPPPPPEPELIRRIRDIVEMEIMISSRELQAKIEPPVDEATIHSVIACIPDIRIHASPRQTVLRWMKSK